MGDLDKLYSPSLWTRRFPPGDSVLRNHFEIVTNETKKCQKNYECRRNVPYGNRDFERMDIYYKIEQGTPIVVYIHGGYWQDLTKDQSGYCCKPLLENNCRVIVVDYDLCPTVRLEDIVLEIRKALQKILNYAFETDAKNVSIVGHSAGAHLAASAVLKESWNQLPHSDLLTSMFLISGVFDLTNLWKTCVNANNILSLDASNAKKLSPKFYDFFHLREKKFVVYIFVAENDSPAFIQQSKDFYEHLESFKVDSEFHVVSDCDHFDIVENLSSFDYSITRRILESVSKG